MPQVSKPKSGSMQFYPRVRAKRLYPSVSSYPSEEKPRPMAFAGYKAGNLHVILTDMKKGSPTFGKQISTAATVLDCPPLKAIGVRAYRKTTEGLQVMKEAMAKELPKFLSRKIKVGKYKTDEILAEIEKSLGNVVRLRLLVSTQPDLSGVGKKTPEIFEVEVGGTDAKEKLEFAKQMLGKEIKLADIVKEGELVDVIAVTKGKGTVGPVKRYGVKIQNRHAKQKRRHVGAIAAQTPRRVLWTSRMAGQLGTFTRTELNKRVLKIGEGTEINPKSGFLRYGLIKGSYLLLQGSVPGSKKRLVVVRTAIRPTKLKMLPQEIKEIVVGS